MSRFAVPRQTPLTQVTEPMRPHWLRLTPLRLSAFASILLYLVIVPSCLHAAQRDTWKKIKSFPTSIGCGFFFDKDHGLIGSGVRPATYVDTNGDLRVVPGAPINIYKTTDGGATWTTCVVPMGVDGAVTSISMQNELVGYASIFSTLEYDFYGTFGHSGLWKTTDGGNTWTNDFRMDHVTTSVYAQNGLLLYTKWDLFEVFRYSKRAYFPALDTFGGSYSYDDGQTWTKDFRRGNGIAFSDSLNGVVSEMNGSRANFWCTKDAGRTWQQTSGLYEAWSVYAIKDRNIFFTSNESQQYLPHDSIYWSVDSGMTWKNRAGFPAMHFTGTINGKGSTLYIQTDTAYYDQEPLTFYGMYRSDDTGATWHWVAGPSHSRDSRFVVTGCSGEVVYAFDAFGGVWKTVDGGDGTMDGGNPNDAELVLERDSISVTPNPCSDTLSIVVYSASCVPATVDSVVQISGTDLIPTTLSLPKRLEENDSLHIPLAYSPISGASTLSTIRVYSHAGYRRMIRDVKVNLTNTSNAGIMLSKTHSLLTAVGCESKRDTLYLASVGCSGMIVDSAIIPNGEITLLNQFPVTVSDLHTLPIKILFAPDSAGQHDISIHLYAHLNRRTFDTIITVSATSIRAPLYFVMDSAAMSFRTKYCTTENSVIHMATSSCDSVTIDSVINGSASFITNWSPPAIAAHGTDSVGISFVPDSIGLYSGSIHIYAHSKQRGFDTVIYCAGLNAGLPQALTMTKSALSLATSACQLAQDSLVLSNQACDALIIDTVIVPGTEVTVSYDKSHSVLQSNDSLRLRVHFSPDSGSTRLVAVHVLMHNSTRAIDTILLVTATNTIPAYPLSLAPSSLSLTTKYCQPVAQDVTLSNWDCPDLMIDSVGIIGDTRHEFAVNSNSDTLTTQTSGAVTLVFSPDTSGTRHIQLHFFLRSGENAFDTILEVDARNITAPEPYLPILDSAYAGGVRTIPVMLRPTSDPFTMTSYTAHLKFNTNILTPKGLDFTGTCSQNIISSAMDETPDGASIRVTLKDAIADTSQLTLPLVKLVTKVSLTTALNTAVELDTFATDVEPTLKLCSVPMSYFRTALACGDPTLLTFMRTGKATADIIGVSPNPVQSQRNWKLSYDVFGGEPQLSVEIYDAQGTRVYHDESVDASTGKHSITVPTPNANGDYFLLLRSNEVQDVRKVTVAR